MVAVSYTALMNVLCHVRQHNYVVVKHLVSWLMRLTSLARLLQIVSTLLMLDTPSKSVRDF